MFFKALKYQSFVFKFRINSDKFRQNNRKKKNQIHWSSNHLASICNSNSWTFVEV